MKTALTFLTACLRGGRAPGPAPAGLELSPLWAERWGLSDSIARAS